MQQIDISGASISCPCWLNHGKQASHLTPSSCWMASKGWDSLLRHIFMPHSTPEVTEVSIYVVREPNLPCTPQFWRQYVLRKVHTICNLFSGLIPTAECSVDPSLCVTTDCRDSARSELESFRYIFLKQFININDRRCMVKATSELVARWGFGTNVYNTKIVVGSFGLYSVPQTRGSIQNPCYENLK